MMVIICNSFQEVQDNFDVFVYYLKLYEPLNIRRIYPYNYTVDTYDGIKYTFIDYRFKKLFEAFDKSIDFIDAPEFFEGMEIDDDIATDT